MRGGGIRTPTSVARATRGLRRPSLGLMARLGVPVGGRVRKRRAAGDQSAPIPEEIMSKLGRSIWKDEGRSMRAVEDHWKLPLEETSLVFSAYCVKLQCGIGLSRHSYNQTFCVSARGHIDSMARCHFTRARCTPKLGKPVPELQGKPTTGSRSYRPS